MEVWEVKAEPLWGDIYLMFREEDYGRVRLPGLMIQAGSSVRIYSDIDAALRHIRKLHDQRLKGTS
jgi:hypothetical protein